MNLCRARVRHSLRYMTAVALTVGSSAVLSSTVASAVEENHCAAAQVGIAASGEIKLGPTECFATLEGAIDYLQETDGDRLARGITALTTFYDPASYSGTSFSSAAACGGGYINFNNFAYPGGGHWDNRVSAVATSCSYVALYYNYNLTGTRYQINGSGTLPGTGMDNQSSSAGIAYG